MSTTNQNCAPARNTTDKTPIVHNETRAIGALKNTIAGAWNLDFTTRRRQNIRRLMRQRLRCNPQGKGNRAWKRVDLASRDASCLSWPDFYYGIL